MRLLLDTHILVWTLTEPRRLPAPILDMIEDGRNTTLFSAASIWEIAIKAALGKQGFGHDAKLIVDGAHAVGILELQITSATAIIAGSLPRIHGDPFDRMLVAQAIGEAARLLTSDRLLRRYSDLVTVV